MSGNAINSRALKKINKSLKTHLLEKEKPETAEEKRIRKEDEFKLRQKELNQAPNRGERKY